MSHDENNTPPRQKHPFAGYDEDHDYEEPDRDTDYATVYADFDDEDDEEVGYREELEEDAEPETDEPEREPSLWTSNEEPEQEPESWTSNEELEEDSSLWARDEEPQMDEPEADLDPARAPEHDYEWQDVERTRDVPIYERQTVTGTRWVQVFVPYDTEAGGGTAVGGGGDTVPGEYVWVQEEYQYETDVIVGYTQETYMDSVRVQVDTVTETRSRERDTFVVLVKPSSIPYAMDLVRVVGDAGFDVGYEPLAEPQSVRFPEEP